MAKKPTTKKKKNTKKTPRLVLISAIVILIAGLLFVIIGDKQTKTVEAPSNSEIDSSYSEASENYLYYASLLGDEYDRAYLEDMIIHNKGTIIMSELALSQAVHQELKDFASSTITSKNTENEQMKQWQYEWGYLSSENQELSSSAVTISNANEENTAALNGLEGEAFDEAYLNEMTEHYTTAVEMSMSAPTNALHNELIGFANQIVLVQNQDLEKMYEWHAIWGYQD